MGRLYVASSIFPNSLGVNFWAYYCFHFLSGWFGTLVSSLYDYSAVYPLTFA